MRRTRRDFVRLAAGAVAAVETLPRLGAQTGDTPEAPHPISNPFSIPPCKDAHRSARTLPNSPSILWGTTTWLAMYAAPAAFRTSLPCLLHRIGQLNTVCGTTGDPAWSFNFSESGIVIRSHILQATGTNLWFSTLTPSSCHANLTLALLMTKGRFPSPRFCIFPCAARFASPRVRRMSASVTMRPAHGRFRPRQRFHPHLATAEDEYRLDVTCVYPHLANHLTTIRDTMATGATF